MTMEMQNRLARWTVEEFVLLGRIPYYGRFRFLETKNDLQIARDVLAISEAAWENSGRLTVPINS